MIYLGQFYLVNLSLINIPLYEVKKKFCIWTLIGQGKINIVFKIGILYISVAILWDKVLQFISLLATKG